METPGFFVNPDFFSGCFHEPAQGAREAVDSARARPAGGRLQAQGEGQRQAEGILCKPGENFQTSRCFSKEIMSLFAVVYIMQTAKV